MKKTVSLLLATFMIVLMLLSGAAAYADDTEPTEEEKAAGEDVTYYSQKYVDAISDINTADTAPGYDEFFGEANADETAEADIAPESAETAAPVIEGKSSSGAAETKKGVPAVSSTASESAPQKNISVATISVLVIVAGLVGASVVLLVDKK